MIIQNFAGVYVLLYRKKLRIYYDTTIMGVIKQALG